LKERATQRKPKEQRYEQHCMQRRGYKSWGGSLVHGCRDACHYFSFEKRTSVSYEYE
jgi:hypothetical protein